MIIDDDAAFKSEELFDWRVESVDGKRQRNDLDYAGSIAAAAIAGSTANRRFAVGVFDAPELDEVLRFPGGTFQALVDLGLAPKHELRVDQTPIFRVRDVGAWMASKKRRSALKALERAIDDLFEVDE